MQVLWSYQPVIQIYPTLFLSFFTNFSTLTKLDLGRAALCVFMLFSLLDLVVRSDYH